MPVPRPLSNPFLSGFCPITPLKRLIIKATSDVHVTNPVVISQAFDKGTAASSGTTLLPGVPAAFRGPLWLVPAHLPPVLSPWPLLLSLWVIRSRPMASNAHSGPISRPDLFSEVQTHIPSCLRDLSILLPPAPYSLVSTLQPAVPLKTVRSCPPLHRISWGPYPHPTFCVFTRLFFYGLSSSAGT